MPIRDYIKDHLAKGYSKDQIKNTLIQHGYTQDQVAEAFKPSQTNFMHIILLVGCIIGLVLLLSGIYYMTTSTPITQEGVTDTQAEIDAPTSELIPDQLPTTTRYCEDKTCAKENFKECVPTQGTYSMYFVLKVEYEILGMKDNLCEVFGKVVSSPDSSFEGKSMKCLLDNTQDLEDAMQKADQCTGDLADAIRKAQPK